MDAIDSGCETADFFLSLELKKQRISAPPKQPTGFCYNCGDPIPEGLYCDSDCMTDLEKRERIQNNTRSNSTVLG